MEKTKYSFRFPILDGGRRQGINDSGIATFDGSDLYNNLAREICQNSLDAKLENDEPVQVSFKLEHIFKSDFYCFEQIEEILIRCKNYYQSYEDEKIQLFINEAEALLSNETIPIMIISDSNTKGLDGSRTNEKSWEALTSSSGITSKADGSGGSYGIGKNAPFACSILRTVFYNTYSYLDNEKAFQGVCSLMTHKNENDEETQSCGFFQNIVERKPLFEEDECSIKNIVHREIYGTDIVILGFRERENYIDEMTFALIKNFYVAICENKLVVDVNGIEIRRNNIIDLVENLISREIYRENKDLLLVKHLISIVLNKENQKSFSILEENDVLMFIGLSDEGYRTISDVRATGMSIRYRSKKMMRAYDAVVMILGSEANKILKKIEPPKHDKWDAGLLKKPEEYKKAQSLITKIGMHTSKYIEEICKCEDSQEIDPDGVFQFLPDDVSDIGAGKAKETKGLESVISISKVKINKVKLGEKKTLGALGQGEVQQGSVHNETEGGTRPGITPPSDGEYGTDITITPNKEGKKLLDVSTYQIFRLLPLNEDNGVYKLIISNKNKKQKISFSFSASGEDGNTEKLIIEGYSIDRKFHNVKDTSSPKIDINENEITKIIFKLSSSERLRITVGGIVYE